jgi:hypothetical protein
MTGLKSKMVSILLFALISIIVGASCDDSDDDDSPSHSGFLGKTWEMDAGDASFWIIAKNETAGFFLLHYSEGKLHSILPGWKRQEFLTLGDVTKDYFLTNSLDEILIFKNNEELFSISYLQIDSYHPWVPYSSCLTEDAAHFVQSYETAAQEMGPINMYIMDLASHSQTEIAWPSQEEPNSFHISAMDCRGSRVLVPFSLNIYHLNGEKWENLGAIPNGHMDFLNFNGWFRDDESVVWTLTYGPDADPDYGRIPNCGWIPSVLGKLENEVHTQITGNEYTMMDLAETRHLFLAQQTWEELPGENGFGVPILKAYITEYQDGIGAGEPTQLTDASDHVCIRSLASPSPDHVLVLSEVRGSYSGNSYRIVELPDELQAPDITWQSIHAVAP